MTNTIVIDGRTVTVVNTLSSGPGSEPHTYELRDGASVYLVGRTWWLQERGAAARTVNVRIWTPEGGCLRGITDDERALVNHIARWGSDGYPIKKYRVGKWTWGPFLSVKGSPVLYKTKREAVASFEAFHDVLLDALAGQV